MMTASLISELAAEIGRYQPAMIRDLETLVALETPTRHKSAVDRAQSQFSEWLQRAGACVERYMQGTYGDHILARWQNNADTGLGQVTLIGHMDTVWPIGELDRRPVRCEAGFLRGPGAFDMKAGLIMALYAMHAVRELRFPLARDVVFIVNSDEEVGSPTSRALIEAEARRSQAVLVLEPAVDTDCLTVSRKGVGRFAVHVEGLAAHSGNNHDRGVNAIEELARHVLALQAMTNYENGTTVNVGVIHGGTASNVVPPYASAQVDVRVQTLVEGERIMQEIRNLKPYNARTRVRVEGGLTRPPWEMSTTTEALFYRARGIGLELGMDLQKAVSGGGSDGNFTAALGIPTLDGLGPEGAGAHAEDERVRLDRLVPRAALLACLISSLAINGR